MYFQKYKGVALNIDYLRLALDRKAVYCSILRLFKNRFIYLALMGTNYFFDIYKFSTASL